MKAPVLRLLIVCMAVGWLGGCYYTATDRDGTTRRISGSEYRELQKEQPVTGKHWSGAQPP